MENVFQRLKEVYIEFVRVENRYLENFREDPSIKAGQLANLHEIRAFNSYFNNHDLTATKQAFYLCGRLSEYRITNFDSDLLDYALNLLFYTFLSDNPHLIKRFTSWTFTQMELMIKMGRGALKTNTMQLLLKRDLDGVERNLEIMKKVVAKKSGAWAVLDYHFYKALAAQDKLQAEQILAEFVTPKNHKARNQHFLLVGDLISVPAIGYAKLAWLLGMEVNVNSPYIPKDWLPVQPLAVYDDYYGFLKDDKVKHKFK